LKGEIVLVLGRGEAVEADAATIEAALDRALTTMKVKDAATAVAEAFGLPKREVYQMALARGSADQSR
jgi:16S rRNA (cytidine1402-2'-O)-methyltransferase